MPSIRCDALVLGSTLGGLVAGSFLARAGLRVVLIEEEVHQKRPSLLREPFLLTGLERGGPVGELLGELAIPLLERREIAPREIALQVLLPGGARIDVGRGRRVLSSELDLYGVVDRATALTWLETADRVGDALRDHYRGRKSGEPPALPAPPEALTPLVQAHLTAVSARAGPGRRESAALALRVCRDGAFLPLHSGRGFLDLFRRRFLSLYGEIRSVGSFALWEGRREVGVELLRERLFARALVLAVPLQPLAEFAAESGPVPRWLSGSSPPILRPRAVLRAETEALPVGMAARVVSAAADDPLGYWSLARSPDPDDPGTEWLLAGGPAGASAAADPTLGGLTPFSAGRIVRIDPGPCPRWDLDASDLAVPAPLASRILKRRPWIEAVGAEAAPETGVEGEVLLARETGRRIARALGR